MPKKEYSNKYISLFNIALLSVILFVSLCGLARTVLKPKSVNTYENRSAYRLSKPTASTWLDKSFQDQTEAALNDQIPGAQRMKKAYQHINNILKYQTLQTIYRMNPNQKIVYSGHPIYHGKYIAYKPNQKDDAYAALEAKTQSLNHTVDTHPDIDFYLYYIEKDTDMNFDTGEPLLGYEYLKDRLNIPQANMAKFSINSLDEFETYFYQTDHHWNFKGSYLAYQQVLSLFTDEKALAPLEQRVLSDSFSGSKSSMLGAKGLFQEPFEAYRFAYPPMSITINGEKADDYGNQEAFWNKENKEAISYGAFYGGDDGEIIFQNDQSDERNILIVGESYDNAILKLLASHFHHTYSIDLRHYERTMGKKFDFDSYVKEHDIDSVLLIGNVDFYKMETFVLEDE